MSRHHRLSAWCELLGHYRRTFAHFWAQRKSLDGGLFNEQEAEFLPAALSLQEKPVSASVRLTAGLLIALVAIALAWSVFGKIDIIVSATGKIIPSGYTKTIASVDVAAVRVLHVEEGQAVKAGDPLLDLDTSASDAERDKAQGDEILARLQMARSQALIAALASGMAPRLPKMDGISKGQWQDAQRQLDGQYRDYASKLARIDGDIAHAAENLPLATRRANDYKELTRDHDVSEHAWIDKEQARIDFQRQLMDAQNQRVALIAQTAKEAHDALREGERIAGSSHQDARRASEHSNLLHLTAPVDGTVQQLTVHTVGAAVPAAQPLMLIVPRQGPVEVEAFLENKDVGFVQEGQLAAIKIDAFEYTKYGTIPAHVIHVSRDAIQDEKKGLIYAVKIALDRASINIEGRDMPLSAGMSANAEIKTGTRRVIEYILSPLVRHQHEALRER